MATSTRRSRSETAKAFLTVSETATLLAQDRPRYPRVHDKPLLSVAEVAILIGRDRSMLYDAIKEGTLPLPVVRLRKQLFVPRAAVQRLMDGTDDRSRTTHCRNCGSYLDS